MELVPLITASEQCTAVSDVRMDVNNANHLYTFKIWGPVQIVFVYVFLLHSKILAWRAFVFWMETATHH